jgi:hypothetical protein
VSNTNITDDRCHTRADIQSRSRLRCIIGQADRSQELMVRLMMPRTGSLLTCRNLLQGRRRRCNSRRSRWQSCQSSCFPTAAPRTLRRVCSFRGPNPRDLYILVRVFHMLVRSCSYLTLFASGRKSSPWSRVFLATFIKASGIVAKLNVRTFLRLPWAPSVPYQQDTIQASKCLHRQCPCQRN